MNRQTKYSTGRCSPHGSRAGIFTEKKPPLNDKSGKKPLFLFNFLKYVKTKYLIRYKSGRVEVKSDIFIKNDEKLKNF